MFLRQLSKWSQMPKRTKQGELPANEATEIERVAALLGGYAVLRHRLFDQLDVHEFLNRGLPRAAVTHLYKNITLLHSRDFFEHALGMSQRTFQRSKLTPGKPLNREQSGRIWKFAEIVAKAIEVFGSQEEALAWLERPALGLEQRRPIDLLSTTAGVKLVEDLLGRLEYGVYT
jgi:putative toxin-antitoxin system antitoxin component (TIGR02293 family)